MPYGCRMDAVWMPYGCGAVWMPYGTIMGAVWCRMDHTASIRHTWSGTTYTSIPLHEADWGRAYVHGLHDGQSMWMLCGTWHVYSGPGYVPVPPASLSRAIRHHTAPYGTIWYHTAPCGTIRHLYGNSVNIDAAHPSILTAHPSILTAHPSILTVQRKSMRHHTAPYGTIRHAYGTIHQPYGTIRQPYGTIRHPYGNSTRMDRAAGVPAAGSTADAARAQTFTGASDGRSRRPNGPLGGSGRVHFGEQAIRHLYGTHTAGILHHTSTAPIWDVFDYCDRVCCFATRLQAGPFKKVF